MPLDGSQLLIEIPEILFTDCCKPQPKVAIGGVEVACDDRIERLRDDCLGLLVDQSYRNIIFLGQSSPGLNTLRPSEGVRRPCWSQG
jgi:hypothetical protein